MAPSDGADDEDNAREFSYSTDDADERLIDIIEAIATVKGVNALNLTPLSEAVDIDMLYELLESMGPNEFYRSSSTEPSNPSLFRFEYEGCSIEIKPDRFIVREI